MGYTVAAAGLVAVLVWLWAWSTVVTCSAVGARRGEAGCGR